MVFLFCFFNPKRQIPFRLPLAVGTRMAAGRLTTLLLASGHHPNICSAFLKVVFTSCSSQIHFCEMR